MFFIFCSTKPRVDEKLTISQVILKLEKRTLCHSFVATMSNNFLFSLILLAKVFDSSADVSIVFDGTLQNFRSEILTFHEEAFRDIDIASIKFHNALYTKLNESILQPFNELKLKFNESCQAFPLYNLEEVAARRLVNLCDDFMRFVKRLLPFTDEFVSTFNPAPNSATSQTLMELIAIDYFEDMKQHLSLIPPIYNQNPTCVGPLLNDFLYIYKQPILSMIKLNEKLIKAFVKYLKRDLRYIGGGISKFHGAANRMTKCSADEEIDTQGCVSDFVLYDCTKRKSGCGPIYKSIYIINQHLSNIKNFNSYFMNSFDAVYDRMKQAENSILNWSERLDECIKN